MGDQAEDRMGGMTMEQGKMEVVYLPLDALKPYERNARKHTDDDVKYIENSIRELGFNDPIGIWGEQNLIVEGHGRLLAARNLGLKEVPCIRLDHLTDEQRRAYALAHNRTAELSTWDFELQGMELADITDLDMTDFGFTLEEEEEEPKENPYTDKTDIPQYVPSDDPVGIVDLIKENKYADLMREIEASTVSEEEKEFLRAAAARHIVFNYKKIADYYASVASEEMQKLMEDSALVIIDINDAIAKGYARLSAEIEEVAFGNE